MNRLTYKLDKPIKTKYLNYEYHKIPDYDIDRDNFGRISYDIIFNKLGKLEDLLEKYEIEDLVELEIALDQYYHRYDNVQTRRVDKNDI